MSYFNSFSKMYFVSTLLLVLKFYCFPALAENAVSAYFPQIKGDLTKVTWAHAVNSKEKLTAALSDDSMMIEADILMGQLEGSAPGVNPIPIMGHPPATTSDLSLEQFLTTILESNKEKGVKLDFKSKEVFAGSENILEGFINKEEVLFPVWLNADILPGPVNSKVVPVDADYFIGVAKTKFPTAMLSIGWTTYLGDDAKEGSYSQENIDNMTSILVKNKVTDPVTFPVRAALAANSKDLLVTLVRTSVPGTTLTIWMSTNSDIINIPALKSLINELGKDKIYLDLPTHIMKALSEEKHSTSKEINTPNMNSRGSSMKVPYGVGFSVIFTMGLLTSLLLYCIKPHN